MSKLEALNRKAKFDYFIEEEIETDVDETIYEEEVSE